METDQQKKRGTLIKRRGDIIAEIILTKEERRRRRIKDIIKMTVIKGIKEIIKGFIITMIIVIMIMTIKSIIGKTD